MDLKDLVFVSLKKPLKFMSSVFEDFYQVLILPMIMGNLYSSVGLEYN